MIKQFIKKSLILEGYRPFLLIAILGIILYGQTLFFDFTYLDDNTLILDNQFFLSNPLNIIKAFETEVFHVFNHSASYYRPILTLSFMSDYQIGGINLFIYHFSNILFHIIATCLIFIFLKKLKYKKDVSLLFSLIFLTHPALTQAVAWIPGRNDSLVTIFLLASFIYLIKFLKKTQKKLFNFHLLFFAISIFTKETALFVLPLFIFYAYFLNPEKKVIPKRKILIGWISILVLWFTFRSLALNGSILESLGEMIKSLLLNLSAVIQLLGKIVFPFNLSVLPIIQDTSFVYGITSILFIVFLFILKKERRWNYILFGLSWFLFLLLPSFLRPNSSIVADFIEHRLYLPIIGFFIVLIELNPFKNWRNKNIYYIFISIIIFLFFILTLSYSHNFSDKFSFWQNAVENSPHHPLAHRNLGAMYYLEGDLLNAEKGFKQSLKINPNEKMAHNNLGLVYFQQEKFNESEAEYKKELTINPFYDNAYYNLGLLYYSNEDFDKAAISWKKALELNPNNISAFNGLKVLSSEKNKE